MGARKARFTPNELELLVPGTTIEWQNVTQWRTARVVSGPEQDEFQPRRQKARAASLEAVGILRVGDVFPITPGQIRPAGDARTGWTR